MTNTTKYQYNDNIQDIKENDIVQFIGYTDSMTQSSSSFTIGNLYVAQEYGEEEYPRAPWSCVDSGAIIIKSDNQGDINGWGAGLFKHVKTKPWSEAQVGDTVICIGPEMGSTKVNHIDTIHSFGKLGTKEVFSIGNNTVNYTKDRWKVLDLTPQKVTKRKLKQY